MVCYLKFLNSNAVDAQGKVEGLQMMRNPDIHASPLPDEKGRQDLERVFAYNMKA